MELASFQMLALHTLLAELQDKELLVSLLDLQALALYNLCRTYHGSKP